MLQGFSLSLSTHHKKREERGQKVRFIVWFSLPTAMYKE